MTKNTRVTKWRGAAVSAIKALPAAQQPFARAVMMGLDIAVERASEARAAGRAARESAALAYDRMSELDAGILIVLDRLDKAGFPKSEGEDSDENDQ